MVRLQPRAATQKDPASCTDPIPPALQDKAQSTLKCLGAHLRIAGDSDGSPVAMGARPTMSTATRRFRNISAIVRELNQAGLKTQTVNDLLTRYVEAASQRALRMIFVPDAEAKSFDTTHWKGRHIPIVSPAAPDGRFGAAPWTAWQSVIPTVVDATTHQTQTLASMPILCNQLLHLQSMPRSPNEHALLLKPPPHLWYPADGQKRSDAPSTSFTNSSWTAMLITPSKKPTFIPKLWCPRPNSPTAKPTKPTTCASKFHWPGGSCWLTRPHVIRPTFHSQVCATPTNSSTTCGGVDQRHSALARCLADLTTS